MRSRREVLLLGAAGLAGLTGLVACSAGPTAAPTGVPDVPVALRTRWAGRPDGPLPAAGDEGVPFTVSLSGSDAQPATTPAGLVGNLPDAPSAAYVMQSLPGKLRRIGATVGFGPGSDEGALALVAWDPALGMAGHCHFVLTPDRWIGSTVENGALHELGSGGLSAPLPRDGSPSTFEVVFAGATAWVRLPDGSTTAVQGEAVERLQGSVACWEFYRNATGGSAVTLLETWAG